MVAKSERFKGKTVVSPSQYNMQHSRSFFQGWLCYSSFFLFFSSFNQMSCCSLIAEASLYLWGIFEAFVWTLFCLPLHFQSNLRNWAMYLKTVCHWEHWKGKCRSHSVILNSKIFPHCMRHSENKSSREHSNVIFSRVMVIKLLYPGMLPRVVMLFQILLTFSNMTHAAYALQQGA